MAQTKPWIDLSAHKARLAAFAFPDGTINIVISGVSNNDPAWKKCQDIGFLPSRSGRTLFRPGTKVTLPEIRGVFPQAFSRAMDINEIILKISNDEGAKDAARDARNVRPLGLNHLGQEVFEGEAGRFVRAAQGEIVPESAVGSPALFLRAASPDDAALCADGFVEEMARGRVMRTNDLRRHATAIHGLATVIEEHDPRLRQAQEAVEAAVQRYLSRHSNVASRETFDLAVRLTEHQPHFVFRTSSSVMNQQYSTPLPMSVAAQRLLGDTTGKTLLEPTIGNGSLVMCLPEDTKVSGVEIDSARADRVRMLREGLDIKNADFLALPASGLVPAGGDGFDFTIANPPFGGLAKRVQHHELPVTRIDHLIVLRTLDMRKADGLSVFIIGADRENVFDAQAGLLMGGSKNFFAWLADHYEIHDAIEIDGALYGKQGAAYPVRMVTVGRRRSAEDAAEAYKSRGVAGKDRGMYDLPPRIPVVRDWTSLYDHVEQVADRIGSRLPEPFSVTEEEVTGATEKGDGRVGNSYQMPYVPMSKLGEASAMVPANMVAPLSSAFERFLAAYEKDVDEFVADRLGMTADEMEMVFSPEQIDAIALDIKTIEDGRGFVVGDQTGQGKGRVLAGVVRYCARSGIPVTFLTEKANLFSDFWRDLRDIGAADLMRPALMNSDARIRDLDTNQVLFQPVSRGELDSWMKGDLTLEDTGYNLLMATYSQFNRDANTSDKSAWLPKAVTGGLLILDESHNATGESNTGANIARAVEHARGVSYSSATYAKGAKSMAAYSKLFPPSVASGSLVDILEMGGEPLQEILAAMLVEDGVMIRREHDLSRLSFETSVDRAHLQRNEEYSDRLSEILLAMSGLSGDVDRMTERLAAEIKTYLEGLSETQRNGNRMGVSHTNFGSRLYNVMRQFMVAIKVDHVAESGIAAIQNGMKPVFVLEGTNETVLRETLVDDLGEEPDDDVVPGNKSVAAAFRGDGAREIPPVTFRNILYRMLDRIQMIQKRDAYGAVSVVSGESLAENKEQLEAFQNTVGSIKRMIDEFPDLPVSPVDYLVQRLEAAGFTCGEVSGRGIAVRQDASGAASVIARNDDRLGDIYRFNNRESDAIVLTRAGSTGLSLHASERFKDQRQRVLYELQIANNVSERVQFFGRVNRRGQVCDPRIVAIASGLPAEMRTLAMQNNKLRALSANTQSNRENAAEMDDVPDILNWVGDKVCKRLLEENPAIASALDIDLEAEEDPGENYFVNRLTGRMCLLKVAEQRRIWTEIGEMYEATIQELEAQGKNPFRQTVYDWKAEIISKTRFSGSENEGGSVFDRPVYVADVQWSEEVTPIKWKDVETLLEGGKKKLLADPRILPWVRQFAWERESTCRTPEFIALTTSRFNTLMERVVPKKFKTVAEALADKDQNSVKATKARCDFFRSSFDSLIPGRAIQISDHDSGKGVDALVVGLELPPSGDEHYFSKYTVTVAVPGMKGVKKLTMSQLAGDPQFKALSASAIPKPHDFDDAPSGTIVRQRSVLVGNLFSAAQVAAENSLGHAGIFTDKDGVRHHAIILPWNCTKDAIIDAPQRMSAKAAAVVLSQHAGKTFHSTPAPKTYGDGVSCAITCRGSEVTLIAPGSKARGGNVFANQAIVALTGDFAGSRDSMRVTFPARVLPDVLRELEVVNVFFYATSKEKDVALEGVSEAPTTPEQRRREGLAA